MIAASTSGFMVWPIATRDVCVNRGQQVVGPWSAMLEAVDVMGRASP